MLICCCGEHNRWVLNPDLEVSMQKLTDEAERRYLTCATFHQRVDLVVKQIEYERGVRFTSEDHSLATLVAACAITHRPTIMHRPTSGTD